MAITLRINNSHTFIDGSLDKETYKELKNALGYKDPQSVFKNRKGNWDGIRTTVCYSSTYCKCSIKKEGTHFPSGLLSKAREFFDLKKINVNLIDERIKPIEKKLWVPNPLYPAFDYQESTIKKSCKQGRGIIKVATGGGKTRIGAGIIAELGVYPFIFYVTSIDLLKQAKDEIQKFVVENGVPVKVGAVGGGKKDIQDITVMTVQTAIRSLGENFVSYDEEDEWLKDDETDASSDVADLIRSARGMIADEVQHWAAETCQVISDHSLNVWYKYGLSATPWRDLGDDLLIDACFGKPIVDINASFLIDRGILVPPNIYFVHTPKQMFEGSFATVYKEGVVENEVRNNIICNLSQKMVAKGRQILILVKHIEHGEILEDMVPGSFFIHGSHSSKEREAHISLMRERKADVTISTSIFDEGIDVKPLDGLILAGSGKSATRGLQRIGRVIRNFKDDSIGYVKKDAMVIDFQDNFRYMNTHSNKRRKIYLSEPRFLIKDIKPHG